MAKRIHSPDISGTYNKKVNNVATFKDEWSTMHSWVKKSAKADEFAFCAVCNVHISASHWGNNDITKHSKTVSHSTNAKVAKMTARVTIMLS